MMNKYIAYSKSIYVFLYTVGTAGVKLFVLLIPMCAELLVNGAVAANAEQVRVQALVMIALNVLFLLFMYISSISRARLYADIQYGLKKEITNRVLFDDYLKMTKKDIGYYLQRHNSDVEDMSFLFFESTIDPILNGAFFLALFFFMIKTNLKISMIVFVVIPLFVYLNKRYIPVINNHLEAAINSEEELSNSIERIYSDNHAIRATKSTLFYKNQYDQTNAGSKSLTLRYCKVDELYNCIVANGLLNMCNCFVYVFGAVLLLKGEIEAGTLMALLLYFGRLWSPIEFFLGLQKELSKAEISRKRIDEVLSHGIQALPEEVEVLPVENFSLVLEPFQIHERTILSKQELHFEKNTLYGIKGENGCGKTTLFNILSGMYKGKMKLEINGEPANSVQEYCYFVPSELFCTQEGEDLSSGQKRILQIKEALNRKESILIFDEPLNYLDKEKVQEVKDLIHEMKKEKIILVSSHIEEFFTPDDREVVIKKADA